MNQHNKMVPSTMLLAVSGVHERQSHGLDASMSSRSFAAFFHAYAHHTEMVHDIRLACW